MDEVVTALNNISASLSGYALPVWFKAFGIVVPILLTSITIFLSIRMDRRNKELQKQIHNRDAANQTREVVIDIYQSFFHAFSVVQQAGDNVAGVFVSGQSYYPWGVAVESAFKDVALAYNKTKLLFEEDKAFIGYIRKCWSSFSDINDAVNRYISSGIATQTVGAAWSTFSQKYAIQPGNYFALYQDPVWGEEFKKLCDNSYTQDIQRKINAYKELTGRDAFDEGFRKYVRVQEL